MDYTASNSGKESDNGHEINDEFNKMSINDIERNDVLYTKLCKESSYSNYELLNNLSFANAGLLEDKVFIKFPNLRVLDLSFNKLESFPSSINTLIHLTNLDVSNNNLHSVPDSCVALKSLRSLNLSRNKLTVIPNCLFCGMFAIAYLDVSYNLLSDFSDPPACISYLVDLDISGNKMDAPLWIWSASCTVLKTLNLSQTLWSDDILTSNFIRKLDYLTNGIHLTLEKLNISSSSINGSSLIILNKMKKLKVLSVGNINRTLFSNLIAKIPECILNISGQIIELNMPLVGLCHLQDEISNFRSIQILDLSDNQLPWLPDTFTSLQSLKKCVLSRNKLLLLPSDFENMHSLEELYLDTNKLQELPESLMSLKSLKYLDVYDNLLCYLPLSITEFNLLGADISKNKYEENIDACDPEFIKKYNQLQNSFRDMMGYTKRISKLTEFCYYDNICRQENPESQNDFHHYDRNENSSDSDNNVDMDAGTENSIHVSDTQSTVNIENWDPEYDENDLFDPSSLHFKQCQTLFRRDYNISNLFCGQLFCPAELHETAIRRPNQIVSSQMFEQFDDADK